MRYDIERYVEGNRTVYKMHPRDAWKMTKLNDRISKWYILEYVSDARIWDNICADKYDAPWEQYTVKEFETIWDAMEMYLKYLFSESIYDVKLYCKTLLDGEIVLEENMQFDSVFPYELRKMLYNAEVKRRNLKD